MLRVYWWDDLSGIIFMNLKRCLDMFLGLDLLLVGEEDFKYCFCLKLKFSLMNGVGCIDWLILYEG